MYEYVKALHIIFIVTWFSGMFYIVRLFIYNTEAQQKPSPEKEILHRQFNIMIKRLWYGITWPSAVLTLIFGSWMFYLFGSMPGWLALKLGFVAGLYFYHFSLHRLFRQQQREIFRYSSTQLRLWNEVATLFLVAIIMLVEVKTAISVWWGLGGLVLFALVLMSAVRIYKLLRKST